MDYTNRLKGLLCFLSIFVPSLCVYAVNALVVEVNNAEKKEVVFALNEKPIYWVEGAKLKIQTSKTVAELPIESVTRLYYQQHALTSVSETNPMRVAYYPNPTSDYLYVNIPLENISIMDINGVRQRASVSTSSEGTVVDLRSLPMGVYLLSVDGQTFKIQKR